MFSPLLNGVEFFTKNESLKRDLKLQIVEIMDKARHLISPTFQIQYGRGERCIEF